ncbi:YvrJ family protein [Neobacillus fumarioli]|uniref:YvrJ family protein n=1 Tax=Neobacillus fumarioli TaxID=105229 RepID=UPI00082E64F8|nr:YvrJ family protein [Neobacillus fumarioli]
MNPTDLPQWISILGNFGFPICISIYLLIRFENKLEHFGEILTQLAEMMKEKKE